MRLKSLLSVAMLSTVAIACVTVAPAGSGTPGASTNATPAAMTAAAATEVATAGAPSPVATKTPKPTRRPRPSPTEPPDIDVAVYQYLITPHTDDPAAGFHVDLDITIENTGTDKARQFRVAVTCFGYTQEQPVFSGIEGGGQYVISFGFYTSIADEGKPNRIVLDSNDRLAETDEDNNIHDLASAPEEYPSSCDREAGDPT